MHTIKTNRGTKATLYNGNCLEVMAGLSGIDCIVTDPPYGISFMGKGWDNKVPGVEIWKAAFDALKPGGYLLAFAGTRTQHRMASAIEDAGFEIRDMIAWVYGSGFPKSMDVSKAIDKSAGAEREVIGRKIKVQSYGRDGNNCYGDGPDKNGVMDVTVPATDAAKQWEGWGTALKPALEPITVARKPLDGTVANNIQKHGTGAINIDACRIGDEEAGWGGDNNKGSFGGFTGEQSEQSEPRPVSGRWPANLIHDGSEEVVKHFPENAVGCSHSSKGGGVNGASENVNVGGGEINCTYGDEGSAARFFYVPKANKKERDHGLHGEHKNAKTTNWSGAGVPKRQDGTERKEPLKRNIHPTVKPVELMKYLCRMIAPQGATILDPFMGSGSTGIAALQEGCNFVGVELSAEYYDIARQRIQAEAGVHKLF